jgi:hypothetical protein
MTLSTSVLISVVRRLQIAFPYIKIIDLDDVYVGIVAHKLNITLLDNKMFAVEKKKRFGVCAQHLYE